MIERVVSKHSLQDTGQISADLAYWLLRSPEERISAVEILCRRHHGNSERLQRTVKVIKRDLEALGED